MKTSYNWLKQYVDLNGITPSHLAEVLTGCGLEVEEYFPVAQGDRLVIGEVLECEMHPDSDHLHVCKVNTGDTVRQIICGAPNVAKGQKVIVALPGCRLPGGEIKSGIIRGQQSDGMICALFELGVDRKQLTEEQLSGIEVLPDEAEVGNSEVLKYLGLNDTVFDISLTPNRADCLAGWSLAKEVGASLDRKVTLPDYTYEAKLIQASLKLSSKTEKCPLFEGKIINNVVIKPSPKWLKEALNSVGVKSINNVVDISNYVMLETGQPLHFYDLDKIPGREITVVTGLDEDYVALDGISYHIEPQDIMITNRGNAIGIAGIMGGDDSKIDENTHGIIIEAATFDSVCIRNTARRLGLDTEAATRFQKGIDPAGGHKAVERSVQLLIELADASGIEETVLWGSNEVKEIHIDASVKSINALLGTGFTEEQMIDTFRRLDFHPVKINEDTINVTVPTYRTDIRVWQDLAEEVIRLLGYDHIVSTLPLMPTIQGGLSEEGKKKRKLQSILVGNGLHEIITYSLVSMKKIEQGILNIGKPVEIANPLSDERRYLHTSLLPSMLETASYNTARGNTEYGLFEISHVYDDENRDEQHLGIILSENHTVSSWQHITEKNDFYAMKGLVLTILDQLGYSENRIAFAPIEGDAGLLHRYQNAVVLINRVPVGKIGVIDARVQKQFDLDRCALAEINLTAVYAQKPGKVRFTAVPRYPSVSYDISMIIGRDVTAQMLKDTVKKAGGNLLKNVEVIDVYQGKNIPADKQSITVSMLFQSDERTLTDEDIRPLYNEAVKQLIGKHGAVIRDS